jgi:hypothetical protein
MRVRLVGRDLVRAGGGVNKHASMAAEVEVVDVHLFQIVVGWLAVFGDFPLGIQDDSTSVGRLTEIGNYVRTNFFRGPEAFADLATDSEMVGGEVGRGPAELNENEPFEQRAHLEQDGEYVFPASAKIGRVVENDEAGQLNGAAVTLGVAAESQPFKGLSSGAGVGDLLKPEE